MNGSRMNAKKTDTAVAVAAPSLTNAFDKTEVSDDANALMTALAIACDPSSGFSHLDDVRNHSGKEKFRRPSVLARHGEQYQQALHKAIKDSSSSQKSMSNDINAMFRVANCRCEEKDGFEADHLDVDHLFKEALINGTVTPQVTGEVDAGLHAPHPPGRHAALLSNYVTKEAILSNIKTADLAESSPTSKADSQSLPPSEFKLRPRSRTLAMLKHQASASATLSPHTHSTPPTGTSYSQSLPTHSSSASTGLKPTTGTNSLSMPSLPYPKVQSVSTEEKSAQSVPTIFPASSFGFCKKPTMRKSSYTVASNLSASKNAHLPGCFLQRRNSSTSGGLNRSFSALNLRRPTSTSTFKNHGNGLEQDTSATNSLTKKLSPSHPNLMRSTSSKSMLRRRTSRGSFSALRRHKVGIAEFPAPTAAGPGQNAVW